MAANEVKLTIRVGDDGSLDVVAKKSKQAAKATEDLGKATDKTRKSRDRYNRGEKGVIGATANSTKAFSKMRNSMTGSSGLVSAYAILASNVFAATAAFNALRRAAQIEQLEQGLRLVGAAAGQNLPNIAKGLKEITGNAISSEQAMRSTALAVSSGFRSDQLQDLTRVAKGASLALGRDMSDALDRLVRGTAKLEPEILDELGIMVRLDDAVQQYADRLGIAEGNLTQFDRRQAFLNATIEQGLEKFQDLSQGVDANPYDKLAAALADLQKNLINFTSDFLGFTDAVSFASRNLGSLTAVATTLGLSVTRGVAPGLFRMAEASAESAQSLLGTRLELAKVATDSAKLPPKFSKLVGALQEGTATAKDFDTANASLTGKLGALTRELNKSEEGTKAYAKTADEIAGVRNQLEILPQLQQAQTEATRQQAAANAIGSASALDFKGTMKNLGEQFDLDTKKTQESTKGKKGLRASVSKLGPAFKVAGTGAKAFGAALFTALPYIGLIVSAVTILYGIIKDKFFPEDLVKKRIDEAVESFEQFAEIQARFQSSTAEGGKRTAESYIAFAGVLDQISGKIREVAQANVNDLVETTIEEQKELITVNQTLEARETLLKTLNEPANRYRGIAAEIALVEKQIVDLKTKRLEIETNEATLAEKTKQAEEKSARDVLRGALLQLRIQRKVAESQKESAFNLDIMAKTYTQLEGLQKRLDAGTLSYEDFLVELELIQRYPNAVRASFKGINDVVASFNSVINKRQQKTKSLFQEEEDAAQNLLNQFEELTNKSQETVRIPPSLLNGFQATERFSDEAVEAKKLLEELRKELDGLNISDEFKDGEEGLRRFIKFINDARDNINKLTDSIERQKVQLKGVKEAVKGITGGQTLATRTQNELLTDQIALVNQQIDAARTLANQKGEDFENSEVYNGLVKERTKLETQLVSPILLRKREEVEMLRLIEQQNNIEKQRLSMVTKTAAITKRMASLGAKLTPKDEFKLSVDAAKQQVKAAKIDLELTLQKAKLQRELLILEMTANEVSAQKQAEVLALLDQQLLITRQMAELRVGDAQLGVTAAIASGVTESDSGMAAMPTEGFGMSAVVSNAASMQEMARVTEVASVAEQNYNEKIAERTRLRGELMAAEQAFRDGEGSQSDFEAAQQAAADATAAAEAAGQAMIAAQAKVKTAAINMVADTMTSMSAALAELGPEGKLAAALGNLSAIMLTSVTSAMEIMGDKAAKTSEKIAAGFSAAANIIGGLASVLKAQSDAEVAAIDRMIEAEKKRDGKSAASQKRIQQMEAKKEQVKKKAFETDKKMKMAQAVMSTAAGIAQALTLPTPLNFIMAGLIGAMGAAQIAVISGMTYQGGASSLPGQPSSVSVGQRSSSSDLAKSQGGAGELAYFRGARGQGGPENFTPAFAGYKNRAEGGNTAFMVGEQGPELFVPERPGRIVPNDDVQQGTPVNATINISAVDAAGVEDVLMNQRGNIISMIRDAANAQGDAFLENINVAEL